VPINAVRKLPLKNTALIKPGRAPKDFNMRISRSISITSIDVADDTLTAATSIINAIINSGICFAIDKNCTTRFEDASTSRHDRWGCTPLIGMRMPAIRREKLGGRIFHFSPIIGNINILTNLY